MDTDGSLIVGLLGCGVVGGGVADRLLRGFTVDSVRVQLGSVLVRDLTKRREPAGVHPHLTTTAERVMDNPRADVIVECLGGLEPAGRYVEAALQRGQPVVSANKTLIAERGERLEAIARVRRTTLAYEAAVGAGIPVLDTLRELSSTDQILAVGGVINSTTNFVLSQMEHGGSMNEAVAAARRAGFAEPDPINDLEGIDSAQKLSILASIAFGRWLNWKSIARRGILRVSETDVQRAAARGCSLKLVARARRYGNTIRASVGPTCVPRDHPFAAPRGPENVFLISALHAGPIVIGGVGAGRKATTSAIISDLRDIVIKTEAHQIATRARELSRA